MNNDFIKIAMVSVSFFFLGCSQLQEKPKMEQSASKHDIRGVYVAGAEVLPEQSTPACENDVCPGLGNSFYLPNTNTLSSFSGGYSFFKKRKLGECAQVSSSQTSNRAMIQLDSMQQFVQTTMASADLSGSYTTATLTTSGTASAMTGSKSNLTTSFHSAILDISVVNNSVDFLQNNECFSADNIDDSFKTAFKSLAMIEDDNVASSSSWSPYVEFLKTYGSHIMMQQQIGSRFQQWESSTSEASDIQSTMDAKACAEVEGLSPGGGWSVNGCAAYSEEEKATALRTASFSKRLIEGGTLEARNNLIKQVNKTTLNAFIDSASEGNEPVRFIFKPIWQLLNSIYAPGCTTSGKGSEACSNVQRAYNLQAAYEGWLAVGCPQQQYNGNTYQSMKIEGQTSLDINTYSCWVKKTGCQSDDSCHLGGAGSVCYCYGSACIDTGDNISGTTLYRDKIRGNESGSYNEGVNNSCYYKFIAHCDCDSSWAGGLPDRKLYIQSALD